MSKQSVLVTSISGERATLEITSKDTLQSVQKKVQKHFGVAPEQQLLSIRERQILGDGGCTWSALEPPVPSKATICLTDYTSLRPHGGGACRLPETWRRGLTVKQLERVHGFVRSYGAEDRSTQSSKSSSLGDGWWYNRDGMPLTSAAINLYDLDKWVIRPATRSERCSFVELIAIDGEVQDPSWYVSHWWGETLTGFLCCLRGHVQQRGLSDHTAYWICAYSNNQWELGFELKPNPKDTSFFRALQKCDGMLVMLDREATVLDRAWCCYEMACGVARPAQLGRESPLSLDIATTLPPQSRGRSRNDEREVSVIIDGLTPEEESREEDEQGLGWCDKAAREELFPLKLIEKAFGIDIENAKVSEQMDKRRILNSIAGVAKGKIDGHPPKMHERYLRVNKRLAAIFAVAGWRGALRQTTNRAGFIKALKADEERDELRLSFAKCAGFNDAKLREVAQGIPRGLKTFALNIQHTESKISERSIADLVEALPAGLERLHLNFSGCLGVDDRALMHFKSTRLKNLSELRLQLAACEKIGDKGVSHIFSVMPAGLKLLELNLGGCTKISHDGTAAAFDCIPQALGHLSLDINGMKAMTRKESATLLKRIPSSLDNLSLYFRRSPGVDNAWLVLLSKALPPGLRNLNLEMQDCGGVGKEGVAGLATSISTKPLVNGLRCLRLCVSRCPLVDDNALVAFAFPAGLVRLELSFDACTKVGDKGLAAIAGRMSVGLQELAIDLGGCDGVSDKGVGCLAEALPANIMDLRLRFAKCGKITDRGLIGLANHFPKQLRGLVIDVRHCTSIGDAGLLGVVDALPTWLKKATILFLGSKAKKEHVQRSQGALPALQEWQRERARQGGNNHKEPIRSRL
eukprot:TRINITY_DN9412_c0_g1_i1.p1 TRINITY_DN9412_c0_g1~~TRINITY_DN9412_c0_g1_i1.p1  ORF type:complete len:864 (+),score=134.81 TRINITY_DN9412_c0_g1_i1:140-2731(+)